MKLEIPEEAINDSQREAIKRLIERTRHAHFTNIHLRINGKDEHHEADWVKYLKIVGD
ncbi:hypothetical protein LCGC14_0610320 [marine sediment metagenome]|uniref:Uncharacterized protein n=1 Tax=marine sediment metagenome TaxID=412755 RepID=A0A0F9UGA8_9ZZZZ